MAQGSSPPFPCVIVNVNEYPRPVHIDSCPTFLKNIIKEGACNGTSCIINLTLLGMYKE